MKFEQFRKIARIYAISHFIAGSLYIPLHKVIPEIINAVSDILNLPFDFLPLPSEKFWFTLSISMMYMIAFCSFYASLSEKNVPAWPAVIISKGVSTFFFIVFFFYDVMALAYIVGVIVDGPLFLIATLAWTKYKRTNLAK